MPPLNTLHLASLSVTCVSLQHYPELLPVPYDLLLKGTERSDLWRVLVLNKVRARCSHSSHVLQRQQHSHCSSTRPACWAKPQAVVDRQLSVPCRQPAARQTHMRK